MKISDVRTYPVKSPTPGRGGPGFLFVKLTTDSGVEGIGEIYCTPFSPFVGASMAEDVCDRLVIGADPFKIERLWRVVYSSGYTQHPDLSLVAILSGIIGDKISNVKLMMWLFVAGILGSMFLASMQTTPENVWALWIFIFPFGLLVYAARGVFWALLYDCPIPKTVLGTAIGFISIMGYSSDAYIPQVSSHLLDTNSTSTGYQLFYTYVAVASFVGFLASWCLSRLSKPRDDN